MQIMARVKQLFWPAITDEKSAATTIQHASRWVFGWAALLVAIGLLDLIVLSLMPSSKQTSSDASAFVWYAIGAGVVFGIIGWRMRGNSFGCSIAGLLICLIGAFAVLPSPFAFLIYVFLVLIFTNAIRAIYRYKRSVFPAS